MLRALVDIVNIWSIALPTFCIGVVGILIFSVWLHWLPVLGGMLLPVMHHRHRRRRADREAALRRTARGGDLGACAHRPCQGAVALAHHAPASDADRGAGGARSVEPRAGEPRCRNPHHGSAVRPAGPRQPDAQRHPWARLSGDPGFHPGHRRRPWSSSTGSPICSIAWSIRGCPDERARSRHPQSRRRQGQAPAGGRHLADAGARPHARHHRRDPAPANR